jgi:hypothetical protein
MEFGFATEGGGCIGSAKAHTNRKKLSVFSGSLSEIDNDLDSYESPIYDVTKVTEFSRTAQVERKMVHLIPTLLPTGFDAQSKERVDYRLMLKGK